MVHISRNYVLIWKHKNLLFDPTNGVGIIYCIYTERIIYLDVLSYDVTVCKQVHRLIHASGDDLIDS